MGTLTAVGAYSILCGMNVSRFTLGRLVSAIGATALALLVSCQNPGGSPDPVPDSLQVKLTSLQVSAPEAALVGSSRVTVDRGVGPVTLPLEKAASGTWRAAWTPGGSPGTSVTVQLYSGAGYSGMLLFQGKKVFASGPPSGLVEVTVDAVSRRDERFAGTVATTQGVDIVQVSPSETVAFVYTIDVTEEYDIAGAVFSDYQIQTRQDTGASTRKLRGTGTVDRQGLAYQFRKDTEYDDAGVASGLASPVDFGMTLDVSGASLRFDNTATPTFPRL